MARPNIRVTMVGTTTKKLRARVEPIGEKRYEVTLGGENWKNLPDEHQEVILRRAAAYVEELARELAIAADILNPIPF